MVGHCWLVLSSLVFVIFGGYFYHWCLLWLVVRYYCSCWLLLLLMLQIERPTKVTNETIMTIMTGAANVHYNIDNYKCS